MSEAPSIREARSNRLDAAKMDLITSGPHVCRSPQRWQASRLIYFRLENWDEYARRQYIAKAPHLNPYGMEEQPSRFREFDITQKIRVLHQLTVWTFWNPDRLRERMPEQKESDQTLWVGSADHHYDPC